ncbi:MAG: cytidine deaminase [Anaerolineae bacterium]|nr:MAG: cytidine deaminase [Anaerolineae bacterium]
MSTPNLPSETIRQLIEQAKSVRQRAYAPYSHYYVGAALLGENGDIYTGCNVENAAYPVGICAERSAVVKAISEGCLAFQAVAVVTENGGTPCGECRQVLNEFNPDMLVLIADADGTLLMQKPLRELLPEGFGPANLNKERVGNRKGQRDGS